MFTCFICQEQLFSIKHLRLHFQLIHTPKELNVYVCGQDNCNRKFQLFNSFRRYILREHSSGNTNDTNITEPDLTATRVLNQAPPILCTHDVNIQQRQFPESSSNSETALSMFIASLYANQSLPRNIIQTIINGFHNFVTDSLLSAVKQQLENLSSDNIILPNNLKTVLDSIEPLLTTPWSIFDTEHKRINYFLKKQTYIKPESIVIGERLEKVKRMGIKRLAPITCEHFIPLRSEEHFIPLRKVLKSFFSLENVLSDTLNFMNRLSRDCDLNAAIENFIHGSFWQKRMEPNKGKIAP